jgi:hypothetical protein
MQIHFAKAFSINSSDFFKKKIKIVFYWILELQTQKIEKDVKLGSGLKWARNMLHVYMDGVKNCPGTF